MWLVKAIGDVTLTLPGHRWYKGEVISREWSSSRFQLFEMIAFESGLWHDTSRKKLWIRGILSIAVMVCFLISHRDTTSYQQLKASSDSGVVMFLLLQCIPQGHVTLFRHWSGGLKKCFTRTLSVTLGRWSKAKCWICTSVRYVLFLPVALRVAYYRNVPS